MNILLMGNPNVGKSVVFNRVTGANVIASNYAGTTVEFTKGSMKLGDKRAELIDVPGTYTLEPTCKAEEIAVKMFNERKDGDVVINVVESTNLERSLNLTLQLLKRKIPVVVALNFWDETKHKGISIDYKKLEEILGVPCVPICAVTGEGVNHLVEKIKEAKPSGYEYEDNERWQKIGSIVDEVQKVTHRHHTWLERLGDASVRPLTGIPIAAVVMLLAFKVIRFIGEGLIGYVGEPVFEKLWAPVMMKLSAVMGSGGFLHDLVIGQLIDGEIDFGQSFGLLTTGLFVPIGAVLPYVFAFYVVLSLLEDLGFIPRLAVMVDTLMHRLGLHGFAIVPMLLGLGCNVPGALATRILETRRERFISATLLSIAVPCAALQAMVVGLVGEHGVGYLAIIYGTLFAVWVLLGVIFNKTVKGESPEIFLEIPPYRIPYMRSLAKKIWIRIKWFLKEAIPFVLLGVLIVNLLYTFGIIQFVGRITAPVVTRVLGLPQEAVGALIVGFLRKDVAVGMLIPLGLTIKQLIIASVVLTMYFPCVATFTTLVKELGVVDMLKSAAIMVISSLVVGGLLNLILPF
ncbi:MAG: ferrous iron transporter B [Planctomycetes bacterium]|nr:ferrous iron transporter B [Planctomycetota bacterium]